MSTWFADYSEVFTLNCHVLNYQQEARFDNTLTTRLPEGNECTVTCMLNLQLQHNVAAVLLLHA